MKLNNLLQNPLNRKIDRAKVQSIKRAIATSGVIKPLVYVEIMTDKGKELMLTDGHHRYVALKELGYKEVPAVMSDEDGVETAQDEKPQEVKKAKKRPCPEGQYRDKDGKCRRRYGYGAIVHVPHHRRKKPKDGNGNGGTPPMNGNGEMTAPEVAKAAVEKLRDIAKLVNKHGSHDQSTHGAQTPGSSKKPKETFGRIASKQVDFINRQVPGVKDYYNSLPKEKRPKTALDLVTQFKGAQKRPKRKFDKNVTLLREVLAKLNRIAKDGQTATSVSGLELTREDLQDEMTHAHPGRSKKGWATPSTNDSLKMDMGIGVNTKRPYKNPDGANVEGSRI